MTETAAGTDWQAWQRSWDRQQEWYMPDREERFRVMLDMVEAVVGPEPRVLDLACGTGSITDRLLKRFPEATCTGVDLDPALLAIARGSFMRRRARHLRHRRSQGPGVGGAAAARHVRRSPHRHCPALAAQRTAHHALRAARRARPGRRGVHECRPHDRHRDPRINAAERAHRHAAMDRAKAAGTLDWADWWALAAKDPVLAAPTAERYKIYGEHADGDMPSAQWHAETLRAAGFGEARAVWASPSDALVLAVN